MKTAERKPTISTRAFPAASDNAKKYLQPSKAADVVDVLDTDEDRVLRYYTTYNYTHAHIAQRQGGVLR